MSVDDLIYLDVAFVSQKFEEAIGASPDVQISRAEGLKPAFASRSLMAGPSAGNRSHTRFPSTK